MRRAVSLLVLFALSVAAACAAAPGKPKAAGPGKPPAGCRPRTAGPAATVGRAVSWEATERLGRSPGTVRLPGAGEYRLRDGRVLLKDDEGGPGLVFTPDEWTRHRVLTLEELRARGVGPGESFHPLRGLIDDGARFGAQAQPLVDALAARLAREGIPADASGIDVLLGRLRDSNCRIEPALFRELTAWIGRAVIEQAEARDKRVASWVSRDSAGFAEPRIEWDGALAGTKRGVAPWEIASHLLGDDTAKTAAAIDAALELSAVPLAAPQRAPDDGGTPPADAGAVPDGGAGSGSGGPTSDPRKE